MQFYSTNSPSKKVGLQEAVVRSLAPDNGLYMPEEIPVLSEQFFQNISKKSLQEIGYEVLKPFFCPDIPETEFKELVDDALNFPIPLVKVKEGIYSLELFHGPTLAFKDVGARFMARVLSKFVKNSSREVNILVATSGDTGSAVANGFFNVPGIKVFVLYPKGLVSDVQEKQFTTLGNNITAIEVNGTFDDCQHMVKQAFLDDALNAKLALTSANSINLARLLPQSIYYHWGYAQLSEKEKENAYFCVPSGNFGNIAAGLVAQKMGLPVKGFLAATNMNDVVPKYLKTAVYTPRPSVSTLANAMDVGNPSNFVRIKDLYNSEHTVISSKIKPFVVSDEKIVETIQRVWADEKYLLDPHGATGFLAAETLKKENDTVIFIETAHPAKFPEVVEDAIKAKIESPSALDKFNNGKKVTVEMNAEFIELKKYLLAL